MGTTACPTACAELGFDSANCGACGKACPASPAGAVAVCAAGSCRTMTVAPPTALCGGPFAVDSADDTFASRVAKGRLLVTRTVKSTGITSTLTWFSATAPDGPIVSVCSLSLEEASSSSRSASPTSRTSS